MTARRTNLPSEPAPRRRPAKTPEARENQLINLATDLAERQMRDGSASSQVISYYLKLGSSRERLEQERLSHENELLIVKREAYESQKKVEELYGKALTAMRTYAGQEPEEDEYND